MATLYHHWLSPGARFARILLVEKGMDFDLKLEKDWERRPQFMRLNPAGEVPVLVTDEGKVVSGVIALAEYLEERMPDPAMLIGDVDSRFEIRRLVGWFHSKMGSEVTRLLLSERLYKRFLKMGSPDTHTLRCISHNLRIHLGYIDHLAHKRHYLAGSQFTMADAAAAAHISVADYFGNIVWEEWAGVKDWYMRVKSRRSIRILLGDRISGLVPPKHYAKLDF